MPRRGSAVAVAPALQAGGRRFESGPRFPDRGIVACFTGCGPKATLGRVQSSTRARFVAAPVGRFVRGRTWIFGCPIAGLYVTIFGGRPDEADLRELASAYGVRAGGGPHVVLFDGSRVEAVDAAAHDLLIRHFTQRAARFTPNLTRAAFVHGDGLPGALFAGYRKVLPLPACETRSFAATDEALQWLGAPPAVRAEVAALAATLASVDPAIARLEALLDERPDASLAEAARSLAMAPRSLQRILGNAGTSFRGEVDRARWARASRQLAMTDAPITTIALDLGFASLQAFTDWCRSRIAESPSAYRRRHRTGDAGLQRR